jgi:hypothetical protein
VLGVAAAIDGDRDTKWKSSSGPFFTLGLSHVLLQANKVALQYVQR